MILTPGERDLAERLAGEVIVCRSPGELDGDGDDEADDRVMVIPGRMPSRGAAIL